MSGQDVLLSRFLRQHACRLAAERQHSACLLVNASSVPFPAATARPSQVCLGNMMLLEGGPERSSTTRTINDVRISSENLASGARPLPRATLRSQKPRDPAMNPLRAQLRAAHAHAGPRLARELCPWTSDRSLSWRNFTPFCLPSLAKGSRTRQTPLSPVPVRKPPYACKHRHGM